MKKFNYKKWIIENKFGNQPLHSNYQGSGTLEEQITGSVLTCPSGTTMNPSPYGNCQYIMAGNFTPGSISPAGSAQVPIPGLSVAYWADESEEQIISFCCTGSAGPTVTASTSSNAFTGDAGGDATNFTQGDFDFNTDCSEFNEMPSNFQDLICTSCEDPSYINAQCECCSETGDMSNASGMTMNPNKTKGKNINTPGAPQPKNYKRGETDPLYIQDKNKFLKTPNLKEIKFLIKKLINKQNKNR